MATESTTDTPHPERKKTRAFVVFSLLGALLALLAAVAAVSFGDFLRTPHWTVDNPTLLLGVLALGGTVAAFAVRKLGAAREVRAWLQGGLSGLAALLVIFMFVLRYPAETYVYRDTQAAQGPGSQHFEWVSSYPRDDAFFQHFRDYQLVLVGNPGVCRAPSLFDDRATTLQELALCGLQECLTGVGGRIGGLRYAHDWRVDDAVASTADLKGVSCHAIDARSALRLYPKDRSRHVDAAGGAAG